MVLRVRVLVLWFGVSGAAVRNAHLVTFPDIDAWLESDAAVEAQIAMWYAIVSRES